jgi:hypothetical protein
MSISQALRDAFMLDFAGAFGLATWNFVPFMAIAVESGRAAYFGR